MPKQLGEVTLGDIGKAVRPYRPFVSTLVALLLLLLIVPARESSKSNGDEAAASTPLAPNTAAGAVDTSVPGAVDAAGAVGAATPGSPRTAGSAAASGSRAGGVATQVGGQTWPGFGTPEALSAPDCDRARGTLMLPSAWAPPCVPVWPKGADNGGATAQGVTAKSIKVLVYMDTADPALQAAITALGNLDSYDQITNDFRSYADLFNKKFETYGRKVELVFKRATNTGEENERADAIDVATSVKPFATFDTDVSGSTFSPDIAARGVVAFTFWSRPEDLFQARSPYLWGSSVSGANSGRRTLDVEAEYVGRRLAGHPARWAGTPLMQTQPRKFGFVYTAGDVTDAELGDFKRDLGKYGVNLAVTIAGPSAVDQQATAARQMVAKLKEGGVTTVLLGSIFIQTAALMAEATNQQYFPEWSPTGQGYNDQYAPARTFPPEQAAHMFGPMVIPTPIRPPGAEWQRMMQWGYGRQPDSRTRTPLAYQHMLTLFRGIQAAGPHLTPTTLRAGMFALPPAGGAATGVAGLPQVSYGKHGLWPDLGDDYAAIDDRAEAWWDPNTLGPGQGGYDANSGKGVWWYINGGKRYAAGSFPTGEPAMFSQTGAVYLYPEPPASDRLPAYPNTHCRLC